MGLICQKLGIAKYSVVSDLTFCFAIYKRVIFMPSLVNEAGPQIFSLQVYTLYETLLSTRKGPCAIYSINHGD
jgi:hypothetical protein